MTRYERCSNCKHSTFTHKGFWERVRLGLWLTSFPDRFVGCPYSIDGVVTPGEFELICNIGCATFEPNLQMDWPEGASE